MDLGNERDFVSLGGVFFMIAGDYKNRLKCQISEKLFL